MTSKLLLIFLLAVVKTGSFAKDQHIAPTTKIRKLDDPDDDFKSFVLPSTNELKPKQDADSKYVEVKSVRSKKWSGKYDFSSWRSRLLQNNTSLEATHFFGDFLNFYSKGGTFIDSINIGTDEGEVLPVYEEDDYVAFGVFTVPSAYLLDEGGFVCLTGAIDENTNFVEAVGYGNTTVSRLPTGATYDGCDGFVVTDFVTNDTSATPGVGESYQRSGYGINPDDFKWIVAEETAGEQNEGQLFPECQTPCGDGDNTYAIYKIGWFGRRCRERCRSNFWVRLYTSWLNWQCGTCEENFEL